MWYTQGCTVGEVYREVYTTLGYREAYLTIYHPMYTPRVYLAIYHPMYTSWYTRVCIPPYVHLLVYPGTLCAYTSRIPGYTLRIHLSDTRS